MDKLVKQHDKELMKMAMIKHEETFKHQVHELHRLYRVQKLLMNDMKAELKRQQQKPPRSRARTSSERWNTAENEAAAHQQYYNRPDRTRCRRALDLELPAEEYIRNDGGGAMLEAEEGSNLELTLATGGSIRRRSNKEDMSFTSDSGVSFSSSSTESGGGLKVNGGEWGRFQVPGISMGSCQVDRRSGFDVEEHVRQERLTQQPPWLFQCFSLNMT